MSDAEALGTLLAVESFMLAVLSLTATLSAPGRKRVSALPVRAEQLALGVAGVVVTLGLGASLAWGGLYFGGAWRPLREAAIAAILLIAILAQPVVAVLMAIGVRSR